MQQILNLRDLEEIERIHARGGKFRYYPLLSGETGSLGNFFLQLSRTYNDFESPRHRHNFDQIRVQIESNADFARDGVMTPGMVGYFPEGVYYGPQSISEESLTLVLQFGGASRSGYLSEDQFQRGIAELKEVGTFERGVYKVAKPDGGSINQDAYEAVWEHLNNREMKYPDSRYDKPVFMRPASSNWLEDSDAQGVSRKHLGTFSEAKTTISMIKMSPGSSVSVPANSITFVVDGSGTSGAQIWEKHSSMYSGKEQSTLRANAETQIVQIELPKL
jgi:hypothetical protein